MQISTLIECKITPPQIFKTLSNTMATFPNTFIFCILSLSLSLVTADETSIGCYVSGECLDSFALGLSQVTDPELCNSYCNETARCQFWTFYKHYQACLALETCVDFSTDSCTDCTSGDFDCGDNQRCDIVGQCQGTVVGLELVSTQAACISACLNDFPTCAYWSFDSTNNFCSMYSSCPDVNGCATCVSGERDCPIELSCYVPGQCQGTIVDLIDEDNYPCPDLCELNPDCNYWSFDLDTLLCGLYKTCDSLIDGCTNCYSGEVGC